MDAPQNSQVYAIVLAAGQSSRMGQPKLVMPWGDTTIIEKVVKTLQEARLAEIVVVTGGAREAIEGALKGYPVRLVHNPRYAISEMLLSLQIGIQALDLGDEVLIGRRALLVVLGDQPAIEKEVVQRIVCQFMTEGAKLAIPSYQMRRGHPWLVREELWSELLGMGEDQTLRDFIQSHAQEITYIPVDSPAVLKDIDTPEDYQNLRPGQP